MPMQPSDTDSLDALSAGELRGLIGRLLSEVSALRSAVQTLQELNTALRGEVATLSAENRTLKDEIARLKELPARPPSKPSGMDRSTEAGRVSKKKRARSRRRRGPTLPRITITDEVVLTAAAPARSRFKGYDDIVVQDLDLTARATRFRRERWKTPSGETVSGTLPAGIVGGFGPDLRPTSPSSVRIVLELVSWPLPGRTDRPSDNLGAWSVPPQAHVQSAPSSAV